MFDIGFWELALIAVIGLIVLGPERLPVVARTLGLWVGRARGYMRGFTSELDREIRLQEMREHFEKTRKELESKVNLAETEAREVESELRETEAEVRDSVSPPGESPKTDSGDGGPDERDR